MHRCLGLRKIEGVTLFGALLVSCLSTVATGATLHVDLGCPSPEYPYAWWITAATNIQDAVDAAVDGDTILVTNGVYETGATAVYGVSHRVAVTKAVTVRSVHGPEVTAIVGSGPSGPEAVRCVYLTNAARLVGFTLTNGATQNSGDYHTNNSGGGVWCETVSAVVSNCVLTGNSAYDTGGGAYSGTLNNCTLTGNSAVWNGGGASYGTLAAEGKLTGNSAYFSGGAFFRATLNFCVLTGNSAVSAGGGVSACTLSSSTLTGNSTGWKGGAASYSTLYSCTLTGNSASSGGGVYDGTLYNCIVYYNTASSEDNYTASTFSYCCTTPLAAGTGNLTNAPLFVDTNGWSNLRLQTSSVCRDAGNNAYSSSPTDLDGRPRTVSGTVDIGAYEFQPGISGSFIGWLQGYGLPIDGSADFADSDHDVIDNWHEWVTGTSPTNAASALRLQLPVVTPGSVTLTWLSVTNRAYFVQRASNLAPPIAFSLLNTNIPGLPDTTSFTDNNPPPSGPAFYRVGVRL